MYIHVCSLYILSMYIPTLHVYLIFFGNYSRAVERLNSRKTVWNLKLSFDITENEWLRTPFKKVTSTLLAQALTHFCSVGLQVIKSSSLPPLAQHTRDG